VISSFPLHRYTFADYVQVEDESPTKHEFLDGEIVAMAAGTPEHAALAVAVSHRFSTLLQGSRCRVFSSDLRVRVRETGLTTYPDVSVICGPAERDPESNTTVTNPSVVVEVTSDSSEHYDRGPKREHYQTIASLQAIVIVSHRERKIDVWSRRDGAWSVQSAGAGDRIEVPVVGGALDVDAIYAAAEEPQ